MARWDGYETTVNGEHGDEKVSMIGVRVGRRQTGHSHKTQSGEGSHTVPAVDNVG